MLLGGLAYFRDDLARLYDALSGDARLFGSEGSSLAVSGDGLGGVTVNVEVSGGYDPTIRLTYEIAIDQTYLPAITRALAREFALNPA